MTPTHPAINLPLFRQPGSVDTDALVRAAKHAEAILCRTMADENALAQATAFTNTDRPASPLANRAVDIHTPDDLTPATTLTQITDHFALHGLHCHTLSYTHSRWPDDLARQASSLGYEPVTIQVQLLERYAPPTHTPDQIQIVPARACYPDLATIYSAWADEIHPDTPAAARQTAACMVDQLDEPRVDAFIARIDGQPAGVSAVLSLGQIGVVRSVYTLAPLRGRRVATALMAHTIEHCARAQFTQVIVTNGTASPASQLFKTIGFRPVVDYVDYTLIKRDNVIRGRPNEP